MSDTFNHETDAYDEKMKQETTELDYHKALQPLYKRVMGEWQVGDRCYHEFYGEGVIVETKMFESITPFICIAFVDRVHAFNPRDKEIFTIPLTIDDRSPEAFKRSFLGMVEGFGGLYLVPANNKWCCFGENFYFYGDTPTLAILKALAVQEGVEV